MNVELRWLKVPTRQHLDGTALVQEYERVLQYRTLSEITDYSSMDPITNHFVKRLEWSPWIDVPAIDA